MADIPHILVVDDEADMCWALEHLLEREGYRVTSATSGKEALRSAKDGRFDVAFVDVRLADMGGVELSRQIKGVSPGTEIVLISGYLYEDDAAVQLGLKEGAYAGFIGKPFDLDEIRLAVRKALGEAGGW